MTQHKFITFANSLTEFKQHYDYKIVKPNNNATKNVTSVVK